MEVHAAPYWRCVDFISDLHLQTSQAATFDTWKSYIQETKTDAVFILGDLFEVWVGDDALNESSCFESQCAAVLQAAALRVNIFIMHGNRDFLMGQQCMQACGATPLADPTVLNFAKRRWLLSHADALCLADTDYQSFRTQVRSDEWKKAFLAKPLHARITWARELRTRSEALQQKRSSYADVDTAAANSALQAYQAHTLIHGHTHRPGQHALDAGRERLVLSDWDMDAPTPRAEVLRLRLVQENSVQRLVIQRISPSQACMDY